MNNIVESEKLLKLYKEIYEERKPQSEELAERVKGRSAIGLARNLVFQCESYSGQHIHSLSPQKALFRRDLDDLEKIGDLTMTVGELKKRNPLIFFRFIGNHLYCVLYAGENEKYRFLKF